MRQSPKIAYRINDWGGLHDSVGWSGLGLSSEVREWNWGTSGLDLHQLLQIWLDIVLGHGDQLTIVDELIWGEWCALWTDLAPNVPQRILRKSRQMEEGSSICWSNNTVTVSIGCGPQSTVMSLLGFRKSIHVTSCEVDSHVNCPVRILGFTKLKTLNVANEMDILRKIELALKALKKQCLVAYCISRHPETPLIVKALGFFVLAYALRYVLRSA